MKSLEKYRGCLLGGAVGDALGYAVEFRNEQELFQRYGQRGITEYELVGGVAPISDDTQMTLFTANGLLLASARGGAGDYLSLIACCYRDWLKTQGTEQFGFTPPDYAWLNHLPAMNHSREPGRTCLQALMHDDLGSVAEPKNNSKGYGGVMRVAPIGLYLEDGARSPDDIDRLGAEAAALTHGHELGYLPAAMLVHIIHMLAHTSASVWDAVEDAKAAMLRQWKDAVHLPELLTLIDRAVQLTRDPSVSELDAIRTLGEGWVAEETLAIAVYCALRHETDFEKAILAAVNHGGDSDSTGAVTGNILGAHLGVSAIPEKFLTHLELRDAILEVADDLFFDCPIPGGDSARIATWEQKYLYHSYPSSPDRDRAAEW